MCVCVCVYNTPFMYILTLNPCWVVNQKSLSYHAILFRSKITLIQFHEICIIIEDKYSTGISVDCSICFCFR
jgi:hypothetical protein